MGCCLLDGMASRAREIEDPVLESFLCQATDPHRVGESTVDMPGEEGVRLTQSPEPSDFHLQPFLIQDGVQSFHGIPIQGSILLRLLLDVGPFPELTLDPGLPFPDMDPEQPTQRMQTGTEQDFEMSPDP